MNVVSNAGPLINLAKLGVLDLLSKLYESVYVPYFVFEEVVVQGKAHGHPDAYVVELALVRQELVILPRPDGVLPPEIEALPLDQGEKHTIQAARDLAPAVDLVLLDDLLAREAAQHFGLQVKGTLGVLASAYREQMLSQKELDIVFNAILTRRDIWISDALIQRVSQALVGTPSP